MTDILIYTKDYCPYCTKAASLLEMLGQDFEEINVTHDEDAFDEMVAAANGARTVPQIFVGKTHVGGYDDMKALHDKDELIPLIEQNTTEDGDDYDDYSDDYEEYDDR